MVTIRLSRGGARGRPFYHVVVSDSRSARNGRYIERLGYFDPLAGDRGDKWRIDLARVDYWIGTGAQVSDRVASLVRDYRRQQPEAVTPAA